MSERFSQRGVINSITSSCLDPDTNNYIAAEQSRWANNLEDYTIMPSLRVNQENETTNQLSLNSQLNSSNSDVEWWKYIEHVNNESNASTDTRVKKRISAVIEKFNIMEESTSESEKETNMKKRKTLRTASKKSKSNRFSNALNQDSDTFLSVSTSKEKANVQGTSTLSNNASDKETLQSNSHVNKEDSLVQRRRSLILKSGNIQRSRKKEADVFSSKLTDNDPLTEETLAKIRIRETDKTVDQANLSDSAQIRKKLKETSNKSISKDTFATLKHSVSVNETIQNSGDESDVSNKILKPKSKFLRRLRSSIGLNAFNDAFSDNNSVNLSNQKNLTNEVNSHNVGTHTLSRPSANSSRESANQSKSKIVSENMTAQKNMFSHRNLRTHSSNVAKEVTSSDVSRGDQHNIESNKSLPSRYDINETDDMRSFVKPKTVMTKRHRSLFNENNMLQKVDNTNDSTMMTENRASIERNETAGRTSQAHASPSKERKSQSNRSKTANEQNVDDVRHTRLSQIQKSGSEKQNIDILEDNNNKNVSMFLQKSRTSESSKKRIFLSRFSKENMSEISGEVTNISNKLTNEASDEAEMIDVVGDNTDNSIISKSDESTSIQSSYKPNLRKKTYSLRNSLRDHSETSRKAVAELPRRSKRKSNFEETENARAVDSEKDTNSLPRTRSSSRNLRDHSETPRKAVAELPRRSKRKSNFEETENARAVDSEKDTNSLPRTRSSSRNLRDHSETPRKAVAELPRRSKRKSYFEETENAKAVDSENDTNILSRIRSLTRNLRSHSETPRKAVVESPRQSTSKEYLDEADNAKDVDLETDTNKTPRTKNIIRSLSRRILIERDEPEETEMAAGKDATLAAQSSHGNSLSSTSNKKKIRQTTSRTWLTRNSPNMSENRETLRRSNLRTQIRHSTSTQVSDKDKESRDINKVNLSQKKMEDFFKLKRTVDKQSNYEQLSRKKFEEIKEALEKLKEREMTAMKVNVNKKPVSIGRVEKSKGAVLKESAWKKKKKKKTTTSSFDPAKTVNKAFLVNGKVYKPPKLPRPKYWATDRLYKYLWKYMEPKYKLSTRVRSEKFMVNLAEVVSLVERRKKYNSYKVELTALMKEMARLQIIKTRNDFYIFCQEFLPYEFRVKTVPMLMPGNKNNIPFDSSTLHTPILV